MMARVVSLFAGIGGFDLGFERAGFTVVAQVEKDKRCRELLAAKWPDAAILDDVCTAGAHNLPACDVIAFGFPCQDLSVAGKRAGLAGGRSGLFYHATRIINELTPTYCLFENVPGLLSSSRGNDFERVLREMDRVGYSGAWRVLDAQWFGVPQRRRRVFGLFSCLDSGAERCAEILSLPESLRGHPPPGRNAEEESPSPFAFGAGADRKRVNRIDDDSRIATQAVGFTQSSFGGYREGCGTLRASGGDLGGGSETLIVDIAACDDNRRDSVPARTAVRRLTATECERLQGFPDGWTAGFKDTVRYRMLGNAVCVKIAEWIARRMAATMHDHNTTRKDK